MHVGLSTADITSFEPGMLLMGWADPRNVADAVGDPIQARALAVRQGERTFVYVCAELCFISQVLRVEVGQRISDLGVRDSDWMLTATHNHSGPSGLSHALLYNLWSQGFHPGVLADVADGIAKAIRGAVERLEPGRLGWTTVAMPESLGVNRAWRAWNLNGDVPQVSEATKAQAVDRAATMLTVESAAGEPLGAVHWFGMHGTTVHGDNRLLRHDHKGAASRLWEAAAPEGARDFVAIFAQGPTGDITPNAGHDPARGLDAFDPDDLKAREAVGRLQQEAAAAAWGDRQAIADDAPLDSALRWVPMQGRAVDPDLAQGRTGARTTDAKVGVAVTLGTREGKGPLGDAPWLIGAANGLRRLRKRLGERLGRPMEDGPRWPLLDAGHGIHGRFLGLVPLRIMQAFRALDPAVDYAAFAYRGGLKDSAWVPTTLPIQVMQLGPLAVVAMPNEPTTRAGQRMAQTVRETMAPAGVVRAVVNAYANGYASYCVTAEEYELQRYEAAFTLFGRWTLAAFRTEARRLAGDLVAGTAPQDTGPGPWLLTDAEAAAQAPRPAPAAA